LAPTDPEVTVYGWELHCQDGTSDKFYRFFVFLTSDPGVMCLHGLRGRAGSVAPIACGGAKDAIRQALLKMKEKVNKKGYDMQTRDFTGFTVPADLATKASRDTMASAHAISRLFRDAARSAGAEHPEASPIP
jgi:hypothetical protein